MGAEEESREHDQTAPPQLPGKWRLGIPAGPQRADIMGGQSGNARSQRSSSDEQVKTSSDVTDVGRNADSSCTQPGTPHARLEFLLKPIWHLSCHLTGTGEVVRIHGMIAILNVCRSLTLGEAAYHAIMTS
jgi:hypothetical protein